jgi:hypothetical protein
MQTDPALQDNDRSLFNAVPGDSLEIKISAFRAVRVAAEHVGDTARVESVVASMASPGQEADERGE